MRINVVKRSGLKEPLTIEKWQSQIAKICTGIADVSQSMIEIKAQPHFYDGITTKEIDEITLRAIVDLIDVESNPDVGHTNYQYVAGNVQGSTTGASNSSLYSYTDWKLGVTKDFGGGLSLSAAYIGTDAGKTGSVYNYTSPTGKNLGGSTGIVALTKTS